VQITGEQEVFFPWSFRHCERKEKGKHKGRRRRVESRENKWKRLSFLKIIKSLNKQGLPFGLCSIPCNKICRKEREPKLKPVERKGWRHEAERRRPTPAENKGKGAGTDEHGQTSQHAFNVAAASSSPGLFLFTRYMHFSLCVCTVQVNYNSLEQ